MAKKIYDGKVSGKRSRGRPRLTFEVSIKDTGERSRKNNEDPPEGMYEQVDDSGWGERVEYVETVAFGALFSLATPLGIKREAKLGTAYIRESKVFTRQF